jgi:hypothetical protein
MNTHLHPIFFFPAGLGIISQVSFSKSVIISSTIVAFHIGSYIVVFQSQGTLTECKEVVKTLKAGDNLSRETKSEIGCEVEGSISPSRVHNLMSFL